MWTEICELYWKFYVTAGPERQAAWRALIEFVMKNRGAITMIRNGMPMFRPEIVAAIEAGVVRTMQRQALARGSAAMVSESVSARFIAMRLTAALGGMPKLPIPPQGQLALGLAIVIGTTGQAFAEGKDRRDKAEAYQTYVADYFARVMKVAAMRPERVERLVPPQTFDEWYLENR